MRLIVILITIVHYLNMDVFLLLHEKIINFCIIDFPSQLSDEYVSETLFVQGTFFLCCQN
jgi:hypothetical protein